MQVIVVSFHSREPLTMTGISDDHPRIRPKVARATSPPRAKPITLKRLIGRVHRPATGGRYLRATGTVV